MELSLPRWESVEKRLVFMTPEFHGLNLAVRAYIKDNSKKPALASAWTRWAKKFDNQRTYRSSRRWTHGCALDDVYCLVTPEMGQMIHVSAFGNKASDQYHVLALNGAFVAAYELVRGPRDNRKALSGWKLHISAHWFDAVRMGAAVLPILYERQVWHKYVRSPDIFRNMTGTDAGKFITIYTCQEKPDAPEILELVAALKAPLGNFSGPTLIKDDKGTREDDFGHLIYGRFSADYSQSGA